MEKVIVIADAQIPFHDVDALSVVFKYVQDVKPDMVVVLGDWLDFPYLTTKFTRTHTAPEQLMTDVELARMHLQILDAYTDKLVYVEGNHEYRLQSYILEKAEALEGLLAPGQALNLESMLNIPGMEYISPYGEAFIHKSFVFKHGDSATKYAAEKELLSEGSSGMSGHTHRFQTAMRTDRSGAHAWYSVGCLCHVKGSNMPPGYRKGRNVLRNQQQGFAEIHFHKSVFNVYPIVVTDGKFISPGGEYYE